MDALHPLIGKQDYVYREREKKETFSASELEPLLATSAIKKSRHGQFDMAQKKHNPFLLIE